MDCVFCAIAAGRVPARTLYEDDHFIVLLDIYPLRPAHLLLVAREHAEFLHQLSEAAQQDLIPLAERMERVLRRAGYGRVGINLLVNDGPAANQHVAHFHLHLIPRELNDLPALVLRAFTRFLPLGRKRLQNRLDRELHQLREALMEEN
ncbi:diadenosine tetraphosphate (Ap4A) HIT family hydrolase [Pseudomonas nitritireducens]|uniref:Diadenosine tetraphosphate (Ap4A) HIT family hydrolase n=1 Tax=Pseudomonas nitroreducens TaxID=46680 RepID=A0A7W7P367_PSENT|nr:HIT family protein [Pseudomonas nitritireducens]MBB4865519.1 diadenosine tetraphosphate (Ap4A) HIT family hydrolase [Pseudomonas nitritireducens]